MKDLKPLICVICGNDFYKKVRSDSSVPKTCSKECLSSLQKRNHMEQKHRRQAEHCKGCSYPEELKFITNKYHLLREDYSTLLDNYNCLAVKHRELSESHAFLINRGNFIKRIYRKIRLFLNPFL